MDPPRERGPAPGVGGRASGSIAGIKSDRSEDSLTLDRVQLLHRPIGPGELASLRAIWWRQAGAGNRLPVERGLILINGGAGRA